jgi:predicted nucleic acid-binding protein
VADAWIAASAESTAAILVHKHPGFDGLRVEQERLAAG